MKNWAVMDVYSKLHRKTGIHQVHDQLWNTKNCWCVQVRRCHSPHAHYHDKSPIKGNYKDVTCFSLKLAKPWKNLTIMDFGATSTAKTVSPLLLRQSLLFSLLTWIITLFSDLWKSQAIPSFQSQSWSCCLICKCGWWCSQSHPALWPLLYQGQTCRQPCSAGSPLPPEKGFHSAFAPLCTHVNDKGPGLQGRIGVSASLQL